MSLGIETLGSVSTKLIERNTTIQPRNHRFLVRQQIIKLPLKYMFFKVKEKWHRTIRLSVDFILADIPPSPRGVPQIEVTFDIDANGILNVNAKDKATGKEQSIRIEASSGLVR